MKRIFIPLLCLVLPIAASALPKVAVLGMVVAKDINQSVAIPITETVMEELVVSKAFTVLDRNYINQILTEKEFQLSGMVSDNQIVEAGHYLGADFMIAGTAQSVGGTYFLVAKMIEVKSGVIAGQASERGSGKLLVLLDLARSVGKKLAGSSASVDAAMAPTATASGPRSAEGKLSVGFIYGGEATEEGEPFNPDILPLLRAVRIKTLDVGELTLPDLVEKRAEQMKYEAFEPFTGPIKDQNGKIRVQNGSRLRSRYLDYSRLAAMDCLVDNVRGSIGRP